MSKRGLIESLAVAKQINEVLRQNLKVPLATLRANLDSFEKRVVRKVQPRWRNEVRRRCAELYATECLNTAGRMGANSSVERRGHFAILLGHYSLDVPQAKAAAYTRAEQALRGVKCLRKNSVLRSNYEPVLIDIVSR